MKHIILEQCLENIRLFYLNVAKKYPHTYSVSLMHQNIDEAFDSMYLIEVSLLRRKPTIKKWKGYYMAHSGKWYFAYKVFGDRVFVVDARHAQNM
ncbi:MAG TPA: hypothetical protein DDY68_05290, partial [Porphyromonadaceae bacterium]|nr:hypothetical protein [Porphyromonadaceae bacterium]